MLKLLVFLTQVWMFSFPQIHADLSAEEEVCSTASGVCNTEKPGVMTFKLGVVYDHISSHQVRFGNYHFSITKVVS